MKILITSGATREAIDAVRFITNLSSGRSGKILAESFSHYGHEVLFLCGKGSQRPEGDFKSNFRIAEFESFSDLNQLLQKTLSEEKIDVIIHMAAVSDYSVDLVKEGSQTFHGAVPGKLDSAESIEIHLKRNFKIVERLKSYGGANAPLVIAFKLTSGADKEARSAAVTKLYQTGQVDLVIHNDTTEILPDGTHSFRMIRPNGEITECESQVELAGQIENLLRR